MRTTVSIDDDVLMAARERARREHRSLGAVLSELAREALTAPKPRESSEQLDSFYGFEPFPHRGAPVSNAVIDQLREEEHV